MLEYARMSYLTSLSDNECHGDNESHEWTKDGHKDKGSMIIMGVGAYSCI